MSNQIKLKMNRRPGRTTPRASWIGMAYELQASALRAGVLHTVVVEREGRPKREHILRSVCAVCGRPKRILNQDRRCAFQPDKNRNDGEPTSYCARVEKKNSGGTE